MTELVFYRGWLLVPIALLLALMALGPVTPHPPEPWLTIWVYVFLSLPFGGMPYGIVAILVWYWLPKQPVWRVRLLALTLPLPIIAVNEWFVGGPSLFVVGIAYGYVVVFLLNEHVFRAFGGVRETTPQPLVAT